VRSIPFVAVIAAVIAALIAGAACGGAGSARGPSSPPSSAAASPGSPALDPSSPPAVCKRLAEIARQCPRLDIDEVDVPSCIRDFEASSGSAFTQELLKVAGPCIARETRCESIITCLASVGESETLRSCEDVASAGLRVGVPRAQWERRTGASATTFHAARSTKEAPVEMCGVTAANQWLTTLRCDDGSRPLRERADAEAARLGNVGTAGRCGSIVDRYFVSCPEAGYEIFIDAYICPSPDP
jgi:hypothetical protein